MALFGVAIIIFSVLIAQNAYFGLELYSIAVLVPVYVGTIMILGAITKVQKRRGTFFTSFFLGLSALSLLAAFDLAYALEDTELSLIRGTVILLAIVTLVSFAIMVSFKSLKHKRKVYQSFSLIMFNAGALGMIAKHLIAPGLHCYACPWATAGCPIGLLQNWVIMGQVPYYLIGSSLAVFTIFGRAFCGWACPFGFLHDILNCISSVKYKRANVSRIFKFRNRDGTRDNVSILTYITRSTILVTLLIVAWRSAETWFCKLCPAGFIEAALPYRLSHSVAPDPLFVFRVVIFFSLILIAVVISRFWCRYFCPLGHIAGHFNSVSMLHLSMDEEKCNSCGLCGKACPMELDPQEFLHKSPDSPTIRSKIRNLVSKEQSNCILCGECVESCRNGALTISFFPDSKKAYDITDKLRDEIHTSGSKIIRNIQQEMEGEEEEYEPLQEERIIERREEKHQSRPPAPMAKEHGQNFQWTFPVSIYVFHKTYSELPRSLESLKNRPNYNLHYFGIYDDQRYSDFFNEVYGGMVDTPVIIVNGQLYLGPVDGLTELLQFVEEVQSTYTDIYLYCNCDDCYSACGGEQLRKILGNLELQRGQQYPLRNFRVQSPGAILSTCAPGALYALYGRNSQSEHKLSEHIKYKAKDDTDKALLAFKDVPVTNLEIYMKKDNDLSNEILNVVSMASYQSGGKLRFFITEWDNELPSISINGKEIPKHTYPTTYYTLLTLVKKYSKL